MNDTARPLQGQVALVTGSASGIGAAIAVAFARSGARVCVNYASNRAGAEKTAAVIGELEGEAASSKQMSVRRLRSKRCSPPRSVLTERRRSW